MNTVTPKYMLDTNMVSYFLRKHPDVVKHMAQTPMHHLCISAVTGGELWFGLARKPQAKSLRLAIEEFFRRVEVLPWDDTVIRHYGELRAALQKVGTPLGNLDTMIAAHALATHAILITNDAAFSQVERLHTMDWSRPV